MGYTVGDHRLRRVNKLSKSDYRKIDLWNRHYLFTNMYEAKQISEDQYLDHIREIYEAATELWGCREVFQLFLQNNTYEQINGKQ